MTDRKNEDYSNAWVTDRSAKEVFGAITDVRSWWSGFFDEEISGLSDKLGDEFTFAAGGGLHYSRQKLVELVPNKKVVWLVTESSLSFLENKSEWTGTKICFDIVEDDGKTSVRFIHAGLVPAIECYESCTSAWRQYLAKFASHMSGELKQSDGIKN